MSALDAVSKNEQTRSSGSDSVPCCASLVEASGIISDLMIGLSVDSDRWKKANNYLQRIKSPHQITPREPMRFGGIHLCKACGHVVVNGEQCPRCPSLHNAKLTHQYDQKP